MIFLELKELVIVFLTGGFGAAVVKGIFEAIAWKRERKAKKEDRQQINITDRLMQIEKQVNALREGLKYIMYDRIKYLGQCYIRDKAIDINDRTMLNNMHGSYHNGLGGSVDLDLLMNTVNELPLKIKGE